MTHATSSHTPVFGSIDCKMNQWLLKILIRDGKIPSDLSVLTGSQKLSTVWLNLKREAATDIREHVKQLWIQAVSIEQSVDSSTASIIVETTAKGWNICQSLVESEESTTPAAIESENEELTSEETEAANAVINYAKRDALNLQIVKYIINDQPVTSHLFCKMIGVHTATIAARVHHLRQAAKPEKGQSLRDRLIRILKVKLVKYGGQNKAI